MDTSLVGGPPATTSRWNRPGAHIDLSQVLSARPLGSGRAPTRGHSGRARPAALREQVVVVALTVHDVNGAVGRSPPRVARPEGRISSAAIHGPDRRARGASGLSEGGIGLAQVSQHPRAVRGRPSRPSACFASGVRPRCHRWGARVFHQQRHRLVLRLLAFARSLGAQRLAHANDFFRPMIGSRGQPRNGEAERPRTSSTHV
jgi:hypothetical protein